MNPNWNWNLNVVWGVEWGGSEQKRAEESGQGWEGRSEHNMVDCSGLEQICLFSAKQ